MLRARREVIEQQGIFCALYSDRASHFSWTPRGGENVEPERLTQVGRAARELGIRRVPAYSPQARRRPERGFSTWQGRLPQELRLHGIRTLEEAIGFLREHYLAGFNRRFQVSPAQPGSAFLPCRGKDLDRPFSVQQPRVVSRDNTVTLGGRTLPIESTRRRGNSGRMPGHRL